MKKGTVYRLDACSRISYPRTELIRIVKNKSGVEIDLRQNIPGRGSYLFPEENNILLAKKKNVLSRALKCQVDASVYDQLLELCSKEALYGKKCEK